MTEGVKTIGQLYTYYGHRTITTDTPHNMWAGDLISVNNKFRRIQATTTFTIILAPTFFEAVWDLIMAMAA